MHRLWVSAGSGENSAKREGLKGAANTHSHTGIDDSRVLEGAGMSVASRKAEFEGEQRRCAALRTACGSSDGEHVIGQSRALRREQAGHGTRRISGRSPAAAAAICLWLALTHTHVAGMYLSLYYA